MTRHLKETFSLAPCLEALGMDSEFLLGDDILVAPVLEEGLTARHATQQPITWDDTVAEFIDPWLGLSYRHARLHGWRAGTTTTLSPVRDLWIRLLYYIHLLIRRVSTCLLFVMQSVCLILSHFIWQFLFLLCLSLVFSLSAPLLSACLIVPVAVAYILYFLLTLLRVHLTVSLRTCIILSAGPIRVLCPSFCISTCICLSRCLFYALSVPCTACSSACSVHWLFHCLFHALPVPGTACSMHCLFHALPYPLPVPFPCSPASSIACACASLPGSPSTWLLVWLCFWPSICPSLSQPLCLSFFLPYPVLVLISVTLFVPQLVSENEQLFSDS